ncbi:MAG: DUF3793 family protein [Clostridia bacterium]|nr:DUF3793 family protein [Clostridia bacterium]
MSQETLEMINQMDRKDLGIQLAIQCAPFLSGIKLSNLLIIEKKRKSELQAILRETDIECLELLIKCDKVFCMLYRKCEFYDFLESKIVKNFLNEMGYAAESFEDTFTLLRKRYASFMKGQCDFPHELGLLLGYPIEDVTGFIENQGKNYLYSGYWKVYDNLPVKKNLFRRFRHVEETMIQLLSMGVRITDIIDIYQKENTKGVA